MRLSRAAHRSFVVVCGIGFGRREMAEQVLFDDFNAALIAAHRHSRMVECGYAFAVQWPLGHCTVEFRKPSLRDQRMRVVECSDGRESLA